MNHYEQAISRIGDRPGAAIQTWLTRRLVLRFLGKEPQGSLLEIGTGVGRFAEQVVRLGHEYVGVEPTQSLREAAEFRLHRVGYKDSIIDDTLPALTKLQSLQCTYAVALHVLEHAPSSEAAAQWLVAISGKVRTGGKILVVCPNAMDLKMNFFDSDWTHQWVSTTTRISCLGNEIGLTVIEETDLRGTCSSPVAKALLAICGKIFPTGLTNKLFKRAFGLVNFGSGIKAALFWRMSWVVFEKK